MLGLVALLGCAPTLAHAACSVSGTVSAAGLTVGSGSVVLNVSGDCAAVRTGLYKNNGVDENLVAPVSGTQLNNDSANITTSKATYNVSAGAPNGGTNYTDTYTITLVSLVAGESGGNDTIPLFYGSTSDIGGTPSVLGTVDTAWNLNVTNLIANISVPTIAAAFSPTAITSPQTSTLTLTITNPNAGTTLTGVAVAEIGRAHV